jgi:hypothetical protein
MLPLSAFSAFLLSSFTLASLVHLPNVYYNRTVTAEVNSTKGGLDAPKLRPGQANASTWDW